MTVTVCGREESARQETSPKPQTTGSRNGGAADDDPGAQPGPEGREVNPLEKLGWKVAVSGVVDGDTIEAAVPLGGAGELRLIGIDAPEGRGRGAQPYGESAYLFSLIKLRENEAALQFDRLRTDPRGGLLAYVYLPDGTMLNEVLLREGYAQVALSPPNLKHAGLLRAAQGEAKRKGRGLWSLPREELCTLKNHGNGIGEGTPGCDSWVARHPGSKARPALRGVSPAGWRTT
jgi:endonuclease YncB( thermonuclease family)